MMKRRYLTKKQKAEILGLRQQAFLCMHCGNRLNDKIEWDHIIALSRGGTNKLSNWQALHPECHKLKTDGRKHNRLGADKYEAAKTKRLAKGGKRTSHPFPGWRKFDGTLVRK